MWNYSEKVMDHFRNPRTSERSNTPTGRHGRFVGLRRRTDADVQTGRNQRIADVKFQTFGVRQRDRVLFPRSPKWSKGKRSRKPRRSPTRTSPISSGLRTKNALFGHGTRSARSRLHNYARRNAGQDLEDHIICTCFGVSENEIRAWSRKNNLSTVDEVTNYCKGRRAAACAQRVFRRSSIRSQRALRKGRGGSTARKKLSNIQKMKIIEEVIDREIPAVKKDGGDIELIDIDGDRVVIAFRACARGVSRRVHAARLHPGSCASSLTRRDGGRGRK
jgi:NifU-like protein